MFSGKKGVKKPQRFGKYEVNELLGKGGMGVVYSGIHRELNRPVAIKTLTEGFAGDAEMLKLFYDEARRTANLSHPNIVTLFDLGVEQGVPYIVMERLPGHPLDKKLQSGARLTLSQRLQIIEQTCRALAYAHRQGVLHRDIKPGNIFVLPDNTAKVLDFGIGKNEKRGADQTVTVTQETRGTVPYMAPEHVLGIRVSGQADVYSAGVVLYEVLTGSRPFSGEGQVLIQKILNEPHPKLISDGTEFPEALEGIVDRALAKSTATRYTDADAMAADLAAVIAELRMTDLQADFAEAEERTAAQDFEQAQKLLDRILTYDSQHAAALQLQSHIESSLGRRSRAEQVDSLRRRAEEALKEGRFGQGLAILDRQRELFQDDSTLVELRARLARGKENQDEISKHLEQAEAARRKGNFEAALDAVERAAHLSQTNPRIDSLKKTIQREAQQRERRLQAAPMLQAVRGEIERQNYSAASEFLAQAEEVDPTNPELTLLRSDIENGIQLADQRARVQKLEHDFHMASELPELRSIEQSVLAAIDEMPSESRLVILRDKLEQKVQAVLDRELVAETISTVGALNLQQAIEKIRAARKRVPEDPELRRLEDMYGKRLRAASLEERRADSLALARSALTLKAYSEAVRVLELVIAEGIASNEILDLHEHAVRQEAEQRRLAQLQTNAAHIEALIHEERFEEALAFLERIVETSMDPALELLLAKARLGREELGERVSSLLNRLRKLLERSAVDEARSLLRDQSPGVLRAPAVEATFAGLQDERRQAAFRLMGRAYAELDIDLHGAEVTLQRALAAAGDGAMGPALSERFRSRQRDRANQIVFLAMQRGQAFSLNREKDKAKEAMEQAGPGLAYASDDARADWERMYRKVNPGGRLVIML